MTAQLDNADGTKSRPDRRTSLTEWLSDGGALVVWAAALLTWSAPLFWFGSWTVHFALAVGLLPLGAVALARLLRSGDRVATVGGLLVAWATVSALASSSPWLSLRGAARRDYSVLAVAVALGCWAIGRKLSDRSRSRFGGAVAVVAAVSLLAALAQVALDIRTGTLATFQGRASGFADNPVYYGALSAGAAGYATAQFVRRPHGKWQVVIGATSCGVMLSGSRVGLVSLALVVALGAARGSSSVRSRIAVLALSGAGAGWAFGSLFGARSSADRLTARSSAGRLDVWRYAYDGLWDSPILGTGPGLFRESVQDRFSVEFARTADSPWADPHNIVVLTAVSLGLVGLLLAGAFVVLAMRQSQGPMRLLFLGIAVTWLLQPTTWGLAPVAFLALGASGPTSSMPDWRRACPSAVVASTLVGLLFAGYVLSVDLAYGGAARERDHSAMAAVAPWWLGDPVVWAEVSRFAADAGDTTAALAAAERALEVEPTRPVRSTDLAGLLLDLEEVDAAKVHLHKAIELEPTDLIAWLSMIRVAVVEEDVDLLTESERQACMLTRDSC